MLFRSGMILFAAPGGVTKHAALYVGKVPGLLTPDHDKDGKPKKQVQADTVHASESMDGVYGTARNNYYTHAGYLKGVGYPSQGAVPPGASGLPAEQAPDAQDEGYAPEPATAPVITTPKPGQAMVITTTSGLMLRKVAGQKTPGKDMEMPIGTIVTVIKRAGNWVEVRWDVRPGLHHQGWCAATADNGTPYLAFG